MYIIICFALFLWLLFVVCVSIMFIGAFGVCSWKNWTTTTCSHLLELVLSRETFATWCTIAAGLLSKWVSVQHIHTVKRGFHATQHMQQT